MRITIIECDHSPVGWAAPPEGCHSPANPAPGMGPRLLGSLIGGMIVVLGVAIDIFEGENFRWLAFVVICLGVGVSCALSYLRDRDDLAEKLRRENRDRELMSINQRALAQSERVMRRLLPEGNNAYHNALVELTSFIQDAWKFTSRHVADHVMAVHGITNEQENERLYHEWARAMNSEFEAQNRPRLDRLLANLRTIGIDTSAVDRELASVREDEPYVESLAYLLDDLVSPLVSGYYESGFKRQADLESERSTPNSNID